jgi:MAP3K TRAFs-binding domain
MPDPAAPLSPLCFVLMPFGKKKDPKGGPDIDFDHVYEAAIRPALEDAGMEPVRADLERTGGIIHKAMFERLLLCDYAVADLTTANANVFYELGVRHAARPRTTVAIFADGHELPFDVKYLRSASYKLGAQNSFAAEQAQALRTALASALKTARATAIADAAADSPLFHLLDGYKPADLAHLVTDTFRDRARYSETLRQRIQAARRAPEAEARDRLTAIQNELAKNVDAVELGGLVDLFLSFRAIEAFDAMIDLYGVLPVELQRTVMVREQLAFAYNRQGDGDRALELLEKVESERGANPETCGLIGRIHKDRWANARESDPIAAEGHLELALGAYLRGYEADWRDAYPGINAVTLLDVRGTDEDLALRDRLLPVVEYAVERRTADVKPGYWEHATDLELAVLRSDRARAKKLLARTVAAIRESWVPKTTAKNLGFILAARRTRGDDVAWLDEIVQELAKPR